MQHLPSTAASAKAAASPRFEFTKIMLLAIVAACVYGVIHDLITAHLFPPYFWIYHVDPFDHTSTPTYVYALYFGVAATWWVGAGLGILLGMAARAPFAPPLSWRNLVLPVLGVQLATGSVALVEGLRGAAWAADPANAAALTEDANFYGVWWAHNASYSAGAVAGSLLIIGVVVVRLRAKRKGLMAATATLGETASLTKSR